MNEINSTISQWNGTQHLTNPDWIIPIAVCCFLILATFWILVSLIYYGIKSNKWKRMRTSNYDKLNAGMVYTSVVACTTLCLARLVVNLAYLNFEFTVEKQSQLCNSLFDAMGVIYGLVILSTYVFLWLRQRIFYVNRMLNVNYTKVAKIFSAVSIFVIIISGVCVLIFSTIPNDHYSSPDGCFYRPDRTLLIGYYVSIVLFVVIGNAALFGLFAHGLRKANDSPPSLQVQGKHSSFDINAETSQSSYSSSNAKQSPMGAIVRVENGRRSIRLVTHNTPIPTNDLVRTVLKKTLVFAVLSVTCDITLQVLLYFSSLHRRLTTTLFNVNAFLNVIFMIFSFVQFKKMLLAPCYKGNKN